jgi:quercetin dioxygenase-like cupin family protein
MKKTLAAFSVVAVIALSPGAEPADTAAKGASVLIPAADMKWSEVPDAKGIQMAALDGDPSKGASHFIVKFASGFSAPAHHHTADHSVTVMAGTLVLNVDGKDQKLPAGSFFAFSGKKTHTTRCETGADCLLSVDSRGAWDVVPEGNVAPAKK